MKVIPETRRGDYILFLLISLGWYLCWWTISPRGW